MADGLILIALKPILYSIENDYPLFAAPSIWDGGPLTADMVQKKPCVIV